MRVALPGLIADTVADAELHARMITRLAGNLPAFESRFGQARRSEDHLPVLAEVVAGAAIFRLLVSPHAALDDEWVDELTALITGRAGPERRGPSGVGDRQDDPDRQPQPGGEQREDQM